MDKTLADTLTANLKNAKTPEARTDAMTLAMIAMVDCQCKTGARVKRQGLIIAAVGMILLIALLCGDESALKLLCFWRSGGAG